MADESIESQLDGIYARLIDIEGHTSELQDINVKLDELTEMLRSVIVEEE